MPTAFAIVRVPQSPPEPRFLSPLVEPSVQISSRSAPRRDHACTHGKLCVHAGWGAKSGSRTIFPDRSSCMEPKHRSSDPSAVTWSLTKILSGQAFGSLRSWFTRLTRFSRPRPLPIHLVLALDRGRGSVRLVKRVAAEHTPRLRGPSPDGNRCTRG